MTTQTALCDLKAAPIPPASYATAQVTLCQPPWGSWALQVSPMLPVGPHQKPSAMSAASTGKGGCSRPRVPGCSRNHETSQEQNVSGHRKQKSWISGPSPSDDLCEETREPVNKIPEPSTAPPPPDSGERRGRQGPKASSSGSASRCSHNRTRDSEETKALRLQGIFFPRQNSLATRGESHPD